MLNSKGKKTIAIIQARMGSKRLPGKVLMPIRGKPVLWHIANRLKFSKLIDRIIIATSGRENNKPISKMAEKYGFTCFEGSEEDLVDRFYQASVQFGADKVVRISADCPLIDPKITDSVIDFFIKNRDKYEYVSNARPFASYPHGLDVEVFSFRLLERLWKEIKDPFRREWFTTVIFENPKKYKVFCIKNKKDLSQIKLTLDYPEDLELVKYIYENLYSENRCFYLADILELLSKNEKIFEINKIYKKDEQYFNELKKRGIA